MTNTTDPTQADVPPARLPDFDPGVSPEEKAAAWARLISAGDNVPDQALDEALTKLLEEIRHSL